MTIVAICGKAGSGKDTVADYLVKTYNFKKISLADPIKRLVKDVFVLDDYTVYDRIAREQPLENWNGWTVRKLLQFIGTELFRNNIDDSIWVKSLWHRMQKETGNYVVADVRFPNELKFFKDSDKKGELLSIKVIREGYNGSVGLNGHASEKYDLETDIVIENNSTYEDLYRKVNEAISNHFKDLNKISV